MTTTYAATPKKMKSGDWGIAIQQELRPQSTIEAKVTTRAGKSWTGTYRVIWGCSQFSLAVEATASAPQSRSQRRTRSECECGGEYCISTARGMMCDDCGHVRRSR